MRTGVEGAQIDLLIARRDHVINPCEMKCARDEFVIAKTADESLPRKASDFSHLTKNRDVLHITIETTYGLKRNAYSGTVQSVGDGRRPLWELTSEENRPSTSGEGRFLIDPERRSALKVGLHESPHALYQV